MAISTYTELLTAYADRSGDVNTSSAQVDNFIALAEMKFNRMLRHRRMEAATTITLTSGVGTLPSDYLEWRTVVYSGNPRKVLECVTPDFLEVYNPSSIAGQPDFFAIVGNEIKVARAYSGDIALGYYQRIPALTSGAPTNWLLTYAPDCYLYGILAEYAIMYRDAEMIAQYGRLAESAIEMLKADDRASKWQRSGTRLSGPTP